MNSEKSKTSDPYRLVLNLTDKMDLQREDKLAAFSDLSIYYTWKDIKQLYENNYEKLELPDGSYSVSNIHDYFKYIIKKHERITDKSPVEIYVNNMQSRITFKI